MLSMKKALISIFFLQQRNVQAEVPPGFIQATNNQFGLPDGVWTARGYGIVLDVVDGAITLKEETAISCIVNQGLLQAIKDIEFEENVANMTAFRYVPPFVFDRTDSYQAACVNGTTPVQGEEGYIRDALVDFDILVQNFVERYFFFELRGVEDWTASTKQVRATLTSNSTDDELLAAFKTILDPLNDYHVVVRNEFGDILYWSGPWPIGDQFQEEFEQQDAIKDLENYTQTQISTWLEIVESYMDDSGLTMESSGLNWGRFSGRKNVGYMQLSAMPEDVGPFVDELNAAILALKDTDAIVIDQRVNGGGSDRGALFIASHFTSERYLAFSKRAVDSDVHDVYVEPTDPTYEYKGNVIEIISGSTFSATEVFTLAMMQLPQVTLVGRDTGGSFSDLPRSLPSNGWSFQVSPDEHISPDGISYEKTGIPADIYAEADLLLLSEREAGIDTWLELALETTQNPVAPPSSAAQVVTQCCVWLISLITWAMF